MNFLFALFAFVLLVGLSSAGPVAVPQSGAAGSGGRDDPANYFGGIYIGSDEVEEDQVDDDQYGEYNPDDYFGGVYIGPDKEGRAKASRKADEEKEGEIDIIGGIGSLLKGIVGFVSGAVEGLSRAAGDKTAGDALGEVLDLKGRLLQGALDAGAELVEGAAEVIPDMLETKAEILGETARGIAELGIGLKQGAADLLRGAIGEGDYASGGWISISKRRSEDDVDVDVDGEEEELAGNDLQKGVGDLAEGVLDTVGAVAKAAPEALEKGGQVINGIIQAKKESRPFVEERLREFNDMGQLVGTFVETFGNLFAQNTEDFLRTFDRRVKCHSDCPRLAEGSTDRVRCEQLYCQGFDRNSFEFDREVEQIEREDSRRRNEVRTV